jgi:hypothetical protein
MADTPVNPGDSVTASGTGSVNPLAGKWSAAGGCTASAVSGVVQDWFVHTQGIYAMYQRVNQWKDCTSTFGLTPTVEYNYIDANVNVWTNDQIIPNTTFSACAQVVQELTLVAQGACSSVNFEGSGFGTCGTFQTSSEGMILRPAKKNANGTYNETLGYCAENFNTVMNKIPGAYVCSGGWDTLANAKGNLAQLNSSLPTWCPTFNPGLVNI